MKLNAFEVNINGRLLEANEFSLDFDSSRNNIVINLQAPRVVYEGQSVNLDFDNNKLSTSSAAQITDINGNLLQSGFIAIQNDSNVPHPNTGLDPQEIGELLNHLEELDGQRHIAEDALATANADLQFANDNLFAAQNEIAAKQQKLADLQADLQSEEGQRQI